MAAEGSKEFLLFGVRIAVDPMRKTASMNNLSDYQHVADLGKGPEKENPADGCASDSAGRVAARERKRGTPWSEEEHKCFLTGLKKVGKGDWRGISKNFVKSRTPTQVASHAQKYFLRHNTVKHRRRTSLFYITTETVSGQPTEEQSEATLRDSASSQIHSPATNSPNAVVQPLVDPSSVLTQHPLLIHPSPPPALQSVPSPNSSSPANYSLNLSLSLSSYSQTSPYGALQTTLHLGCLRSVYPHLIYPTAHLLAYILGSDHIA